MRIAVDVMGGDSAPQEIIQGAEAAAQDYNYKIVLVGDQVLINKALKKTSSNLTVHHAADKIEMVEHAVTAVRKKPNSSIVQAVKLLKEGKVDAALSAGHTGATLAAGFFHLGRIRGIDRPAILSLIPNEISSTVLLDIGANPDCKPKNLVQFGAMGAVYAQRVMKIAAPRVGLLSIGEEPTKGNELTLAAYPLFEQAPFNFIGNVEGRDLFSGKADVIVCDGFTGNIVLKTGEGLVQAFKNTFAKKSADNWLNKLLLLNLSLTIKNVQKRFDHTEYGGAPLLGINGVLVVSHGSSSAKAIKNAIGIAGDSVKNKLVEAIAEGIKDVNPPKPGSRVD